MFTTEQHIAKNAARKSKSAYFQRGTPLATATFVNRRSTYREFTLVVGVCVALIVALTIWAAQKRSPVAQQNIGKTHVVGPLMESMIQKTIFLLKF